MIHNKKIYSFFFISCLFFVKSLFGSIENLVVALGNHKKTIFAQNYNKPPKTNFRQFFKELPTFEQKFPNEVAFLKQNHWSLKTLHHVCMGEYLTKEEAEKVNSHMQHIYDKRKISKKGKTQTIQKPHEFSPGILTGGHTTQIITSLSTSCELDGSDDFQVIEPVDKSYKVLVPKKGKGFMSDSHYKQSFGLTSNGDKVVGIKTLWPDAWTIHDIIIASGELAQQAQQNKIMPVSGNLYQGTAIRNGIQVVFEARINRLEDGSCIVATTYPKPADVLLHTILQKRTLNSKRTASLFL